MIIVHLWPDSSTWIILIIWYEAWNAWEGSSLSQVCMCLFFSSSDKTVIETNSIFQSWGPQRGREKSFNVAITGWDKSSLFGGKECTFLKHRQSLMKKYKLLTYLYVMNMDGNKFKFLSKHLPNQPSGWFLLRFVIVARWLLFRLLKQ